MLVNMIWKEGMLLDAQCDNNQVLMDAKSPLGKGSAMTPKELVAAGLGGCTAMDVIALMKKHKQPVEKIEISVDVTHSSGKHPAVFTEATITFKATGQIDAKILTESVMLSQTKFCGVSAMLSKALPIKYIVMLNGETVGQGQAHFSD